MPCCREKRSLISCLTSAITKREEFVKNATGILNQMHAEDDWIDHMHTATYQGAARSMAAVGMLAPLAESLFYHSFSGIHRILETNSIPVGSSVRPKEDWDCHYVWGKTSRRKDLVAGIIQLAESIGLDTHLPNDLRHSWLVPQDIGQTPRAKTRVVAVPQARRRAWQAIAQSAVRRRG
jgi:hypothetical protein